MSQALDIFNAANVPAHLAKRNQSVKAITHEFIAGITPSAPTLSIRGKVFAVVSGEDRQIIMRPGSEREPATAIDVVIMLSNPNLCKTYYAKAYEEGSNDQPDCYSNDGIAPASDATNPQAKACAACQWNRFNSARNGGRGKACADTRRLAVAAPGRLDEPMRMRIPPTSLKALQKYAKLLESRNFAPTDLVTKIRFVPEETSPVLEFEPSAFLSEDDYEKVQDLRESGDLLPLVGLGDDSAPDPEQPPVVTESEVRGALESTPAPAPAPEPALAPAPAPEPTDDPLAGLEGSTDESSPLDELGLGGSSDDPEDIDSLLSRYDG